MMTVRARNETPWRRLYRTDVLHTLAERVYAGEGARGDAEVSVLFCSDETITRLNREYRGKRGPTDVLSFEQPPPIGKGPRLLGDIVISLDTVARDYEESPAAMRKEVRLLFCHGMLHLLGYDHQTNRTRDLMAAKQAGYLGVSLTDAWHWAAGEREHRRPANVET